MAACNKQKARHITCVCLERVPACKEGDGLYKNGRPTQKAGATYKEEPRREQKETAQWTEHWPTQTLAVAVVAVVLAAGGRGGGGKYRRRVGVHKRRLITKKAAYRKGGGLQKRPAREMVCRPTQMAGLQMGHTKLVTDLQKG